MRSRTTTLGICLLLALASVALYAPSLDFGFVAYDDLPVLQAHPNLYGQPSFARCLYEIFVGYFPREEPLLVRDVTWAIDAHLFGFTSAFGYHLGNVLLNAVDGVLLFLFLLHATRSRIFAGLCAGIFTTLAIHVEPVCWVMGRKDVLAAFFTLLALLAQSVSLRSDDARLRRLLWPAVLLLYVLAVLSKFSAITLVAVLAAHRILAPYLDGRRKPTAAIDWRAAAWDLRGYLPHALIGAGLYRWYGRVLYDYQVIGGRGPSPLSLQHAKTLAVFVPLSIGRTVEHIFVAAEHSISYLRPNVALPLSLGDCLVAVAVVAAAFGLLVATFRYRKDLLFFVTAFFLWLVPYANVEYVGIWVADRYAYLASACVVAVLVRVTMDGVAALGALRRAFVIGGWACTAVFSAYGVVATRHHEAAFRNERTLWEYELALPHPSMLSYAALAKSFFKEAESATDPTSRRVQLADARNVARAGLRYYRTMPWLPAKGYFIAARTELADLYETLSRVAALAGAPLERRLDYLHMASRVYPSATTDLLMAEALFEKAMPDHVDVARQSLLHWRDYARKSWQDPYKHETIRATFESYRQQFPALSPEIAQALTELEHPR
jgi:hypothetical protein